MGDAAAMLSVESHESVSVTALDVRRRIAELAAEERVLLFARYWADESQVQIAAQTGTPDATIRIRLHRLRTRLRMSLEP